LFQTAQALIGVGNRIDRLLKDNLLGGMLKALFGKPSPVPQRPVCVFRGKSATDSGMKSATDSDLISATPM
jgi:hypothetical protein